MQMQTQNPSAYASSDFNNNIDMIIKKNTMNLDRYNEDLRRSVDQNQEADDLNNFEEQKKKILEQNDEQYHGTQADQR